MNYERFKRAWSLDGACAASVCSFLYNIVHARTFWRVILHVFRRLHTGFQIKAHCVHKAVSQPSEYSPPRIFSSWWLHWMEDSWGCVLCRCLGGRRTPGLVGMSSSQPVRSCSEPLLSSGAAQKLYCTCLTCPAAVLFLCSAQAAVILD